MVFWGVNLPRIPDEEVDMEVDQVPSKHGYSPDKNMEGRSPASMTPFEELKMSDDFMRKAVVEQNEGERSSKSRHVVPQPKGDSFDKSSISQASGLDRTTFKPNTDSSPADLDFDEFISKPSSEDIEFIEKIQDKHFHFVDTLKQRNQKLQNILSLYNPYKSVNMTLNALGQMNDIGVSNDV
mmetsp:Transcript_38910/g.38499  ORF Transcript_38910/g.38499 Transcript_38910/m.38499 type:complete len:182 (-) Transcript_38910:162-707(-)